MHEIPYMVNKAELIVKIADLVNEKKIDGISNINDESDRNGMRIVIDLKKDAIANVVFKYIVETHGIADLFRGQQHRVGRWKTPVAEFEGFDSVIRGSPS